MWDYNDLLNLSNVQGQSAMGLRLGAKAGKMRAVFSATAAAGQTVAAHKLVDATDGVTPVVIPKGCHITRFIYRVLTNFESATDAATIALSIVAANDCVTATALNSGTVWDAETLPVLGTPVTATASTWLLTTADSNITATVGVEALTQGKLVVFVEWFYIGDIALT